MESPKMHISHQQILQQVKDIILETLEPLPVVVYLFGSWARNEEKISSDIDVGIWYEKPLPLGILSQVRSSLEESTVPFRVDVVDLTKADSFMVNNVKGEGIVWKDYRNE